MPDALCKHFRQKGVQATSQSQLTQFSDRTTVSVIEFGINKERDLLHYNIYQTAGSKLYQPEHCWTPVCVVQYARLCRTCQIPPALYQGSQNLGISPAQCTANILSSLHTPPNCMLYAIKTECC